MDTTTLRLDLGRRLLQAGVLPFLFGLLSGFAMPLINDSSLPLSRYVELVTSGIFLAGVGLLWPNVNLSPTGMQVAFWIAVGVTYTHWLANTVAAATGIAVVIPAAVDFRGMTSGEVVLSLVTVGMVVAAGGGGVLFLWGLRTPRSPLSRKKTRREPVSHLAGNIIEE